MAEQTYTIQVCPFCRETRRQLAHGRCANECRGDDGIIPPMVDVEVVPSSLLGEACERLFELLCAFGERPEGEDQVVTEVTRECTYNVARADLAHFYVTLDKAEEAAQVFEIIPELTLPAAAANRAALGRMYGPCTESDPAASIRDDGNA